jgi:phage terminase small subunit
MPAKSDSGFSMTQPRAPAHLSPPSRRLWRQVVAAYELGPGEPEILALALVALDRAAAARRILDNEGIVVAGLHGPRTHPCVAIERNSSLTFGRLLRQLGLDGAVAAGTAVRPEVLYGA